MVHSVHLFKQNSTFNDLTCASIASTHSTGFTDWVRKKNKEKWACKMLKSLLFLTLIVDKSFVDIYIWHLIIRTAHTQFMDSVFFFVLRKEFLIFYRQNWCPILMPPITVLSNYSLWTEALFLVSSKRKWVWKHSLKKAFSNVFHRNFQKISRCCYSIAVLILCCIIFTNTNNPNRFDFLYFPNS